MLGYSSVISLLALASTAFAAPNGVIEKRAPTVYLAGDSTMATAKGGAGTLQGEIYLVSKRSAPA
jgi:rhamnogalacturonan acetylesterase